MDVSRRKIQGDLAALLGESALPEDYRNRMLGITLVSERTWSILDASAKAALNAYSNGVNAYLSQGPLPKEYATLNLDQARAWSPIDSIAIMKGIVLHLSLRLDINRTEKLQHYIKTGQAEGFDGEALFFQDVHPIRPITALTTYSTAGRDAPYGRIFQSTLNQKTPVTSPPHNTAQQANVGENIRQLTASLQQSSFWRELIAADERPDIGSNWWAVSAKHSKTGSPIIASDPHLSTPWPGIFYGVHLRVPKDKQSGHLHAAGASFPGVPAIAHGQNRSLLWVSTNNSLDASDVFLDTIIGSQRSQDQLDATQEQEQARSPTTAPTASQPSGNCQAASGLCILTDGQTHPIVQIPQTYLVNTSNLNNPNRIIPIAPPKEFAQLSQVPFRTYGPILKMVSPPSENTPGKALVLQYTGLAATKEIMAFLHWLRADSISAFKQGLKYFEVGSQNWLVTDTQGDLAYFSSAKIPLRKDLEAGTPIGHGPAFIRDGRGNANWITQPTSQVESPPYQALPFDEMPQIVNPPSGIFVNANNDPTGQTLDGNLFNQTRTNHPTAVFYLNHGYADGLRAQAITTQLTHLIQENPSGISWQDVRNLQLISKQQDATYLLPALINAYKKQCQNNTPRNITQSITQNIAQNPESGTDSTLQIDDDSFESLCEHPFVDQAMAVLTPWDYSTPTGIDWASAQLQTDPTIHSHAQAALYYHLWRAHSLRNIIYQPLYDHALPEPSARLALRALIKHINQQDFQCQGASGLSFCGLSPESLPDPQRRDWMLLSALIDVFDTLNTETYQAHQNKLGLKNLVWGAIHRQRFSHRLAGLTNTPFGAPANNALSQFKHWGGFPRAGGYEVVDAAPVAADAIDLDALITQHGAARRVVGGAQKRLFKRIRMRSDAVLPTARRGQTNPNQMIQDWVSNQQSPEFDPESFMRMRWEKLLPDRG
jgi:penicillin amidase